MADSLSQYILEEHTEVCHLDCRNAFVSLSKEEKKYAHYLSMASWYGGLICLHQTSPESPAIFCLLLKIFRAQTTDEIFTLARKCGLEIKETQAFLLYASAFFANMGNYKSFGDTKFIPGLSKEKLSKLIMETKAYGDEPVAISKLLSESENEVYSLKDHQKQLGLKGEGITTYFSNNCDKSDAETVQRFLDAKSISAYNTRLFKTTEKDGKNTYTVRLASVLTTEDTEGHLSYLGSHEFEGHTFMVTRGDYSELLKKVVENLEKAKECALNENEANMLDRYITHFNSGDLNAHKDGSRFWIHDKGPVVESYIGFIESYRDPFGTRGEFEGFVAVVNKAMSAKFSQLVNSADELLPHLPWPQSFEKDKFLKPDFTSLDVLTFAGSGIPAGINIPNYDDIRQAEGFKNVSLGNVLSTAYAAGRRVFFLGDDDQELYRNYKGVSFEVQVGLHELLGHGSGKLFYKKENGEYNFDQTSVVNPLTQTSITECYVDDETWDGKFQSLSSPYEECRAECVGLYLCLNKDALRIFGHEGERAEDIIYVNWLSMVHAGVLGLLFYTPATNSWRQAHMNARYVILRVLIEAGLVQLEYTADDGEGRPDIRIHLEREKIHTVGKKAIGDFLQKLQVYKSTGDIESARAMWSGYAAVPDDSEPSMLKLREVVVLRRQPRKLFVQDNTSIKDDDVVINSYHATHSDLIKSVVDRFRDDSSIYERILRQWNQDCFEHKYWSL